MDGYLLALSPLLGNSVCCCFDRTSCLYVAQSLHGDGVVLPTSARSRDCFSFILPNSIPTPNKKAPDEDAFLMKGMGDYWRIGQFTG